MSSVVKITDETTLDELATTLGLLNDAAKRLPHVQGVCSPSSWDLQHARIDAVLEDYELVKARDTQVSA